MLNWPVYKSRIIGSRCELEYIKLVKEMYVIRLVVGLKITTAKYQHLRIL